MVPGIGGMVDDYSKLPAVRPSPLGQENVSASSPASCQTMNYPGNNYRNQQASYPNQQQIPYHPTNDQLSVNSGSGSLSSSSTSLNSDYYNYGASYGTTGNQGYVNPIYQTTQPNYREPSAGFNQTNGSVVDKNSFPNANTYQPAANSQYENYASNYGQQHQQQVAPLNQQYEYYNQNVSAPQPASTADPSQTIQQQNSYIPTGANSYLNPTNVQITQTTRDQAQGFYSKQYNVPPQYPVSQSPAQQTQQHTAPISSPQPQQYPAAQILAQQQQYPVTQSPVAAQYSTGQQFHNQHPMAQPTSTPVAQSSELQSVDQQYSMSYTNNNQQPVQQNPSQIQNLVQQEYRNQSYFNYNNSNAQVYMGNQYGEHLNHQNYACYTPTVNSTNSYMTADNQGNQSQTTQSTNYSQTQDVVQSHVHMANQSIESPQRQPHSIPTYSAAVNATATNNSEMHMTQSQQQIVSPAENNQTPAAQKPTEITSKNIDLLSGIDFTLANPTVDDIPTLTPVTVNKEPVEESPKKKKILEPKPTPTPIKLNEDLADLDFSSLTPVTRQEPIKPIEPEKQKKMEDPLNDGSILKQFHKEVEGLEKFMETLTIKTLNGVTPLANKWKELQDLLVKDEANRSVSVARLFPDKNRSVDCLPYDHARILLPTATDNYINAVLVKDCGSVEFILTQTPMVNTVNDYWEMVWNQKSNILVCLHSPNEVSLQ